MKVVINGCFGGFSLSPEALLKLWERGVTDIGTPADKYYPLADRGKNTNRFLSYEHAIKEWRDYIAKPLGKRDLGFSFLTVFSPDEKFVLSGGREIDRQHPEVVRVVEEMGEAADGACAALRVVEIPDGTDYEITEYDGNEHIAERHRTWS